jgi:CheY-like chemotaxis protein
MTAENSGKVLLVLATQNSQNVEQLSISSGLGLKDVIGALENLIDHGFIVATTSENSEIAVFRLNPKGMRTEFSDSQQRILLVDDDAAMRKLAVRLLEGEGYSAVVVAVPDDGQELLQDVSFDLVITDGFSRTPDGVLVATSGLIEAAGETPVVLFSAHRLDVNEVLAAGFRDILSKPFDVDEALEQIRSILDITNTPSIDGSNPSLNSVHR